MRVQSPSRILAAAAFGLLGGCWKPYGDLTALDFGAIDYNNPYLESSGAVISMFDTDLDCPDGKGARFFVVYRPDMTTPAPVAIVLHSGAFDYQLDPEPSSPLSGSHYYADTRLRRDWATAKVWETLGLNANGQQVDPSEVNDGTLPAALLDAGMVQLYPGNCWGDLWHNEEALVDNDYATEGFARNGRTFAWWMVRMLIESDFAGQQGFQVPVQLDVSNIYLVGLGDGGRGVAELLLHEGIPPIAGVLIDSSPDDLRPFVDAPSDHAEEVEGLRRIFLDENLDHIEDWSMMGVMEAGELPDRTAYLWSDLDPRQPEATMSTTATALADAGAWVDNTGLPAHVFVNADIDRARAAVNYLLDGTVPDQR